MKLRGRRVHVAGSADADMPHDRLRYAHDLIVAIVAELARGGTTFVVGVGREPQATPTEEPASPAIVFDWTALDALATAMREGTADAKGEQGRLVAVVASARTEGQVPEHRRVLWESLKAADAIRLEHVEGGWTAGAVRRAHQARLGDVLVALSGGEGVEHLATLYAQAGKPVVALDLDVGSSTRDRVRGAAGIAERALGRPGEYVRLIEPERAGTLLTALSTREATRPAAEVARAVRNLIEAAEPPTAFFVRLLDPKDPAYPAVESFFRDVVDPVVTDFGYAPDQMGLGRTEHAWMNQAIVDRLHHAGVVVVDITGLRNNVFFEMGYAFGRAQRVVVTAQDGTKPPFDTTMIEYCPWTPGAAVANRAMLQEYWTRVIDRPPLVAPRRVT